MDKVAKGEKKNKNKIENKKNRKEKCSIVFLKFYVDGAWNQKKSSIGA